MKGIQNFLEIINTNWTSICVIAGLIIALYQKAKIYIDKTQDEKLAIAKTQVQDVLLSLIAEAELDYDGWNKAGKYKRSQVIKDIYQLFPILSKIAKQEEFNKWLDEQIDNSLTILAKKIVEK